MFIEKQLDKTDVKCRFFAQYFGQDVLFYQNQTWNIFDDFQELLEREEKVFLQLKPLSKITDEDAIELIKLKFKYDKGNIDEIESIRITKDISKKGYCVSLEAIITHKKWDDFVERLFIGDDKIYSFYTDYLRSKGYAVPFMGYSVEDLISFCWVRLL